MSDKPSVLILGGIPNASRHLADYLVSSSPEPLASYIRIADKYSVNPPTTYIGGSFKATLENPIVHYQQANLLTPTTVSKIFEPPEGHAAFTYVFDCTGDTTFERPNEIQRDHTAKLAYSIGLEAAKHRVAAYVRVIGPYYETSNDKGSEEKDNLKPRGVRGIWWHESIRMLAGISDLNLVILRTATVYGPYNLNGIVTPRITLGRVYKHLDEEMKYLWSSDIRMHTVHYEDVAGAMWAVANWMAQIGRAKANEIAGETLKFYPPDKKELLADLEGHLPKDNDPVAPLFNIVDDSFSTQETMGQAVADLFKIKFGFYGFLANTKVKMDFDNMVEEINSKHVEAWTDICMKSDPRIINPTVQAYIDGHLLDKYSISYKGDKIKHVVGYHLKRPKLDVESLREIVQSFRADGHWPNYKDDL